MNAQGLAWAWLNAFSARPFALLETPNDKKRLNLIAGEPLFVFEGRGAKSSVLVGAKRMARGLANLVKKRFCGGVSLCCCMYCIGRSVRWNAVQHDDAA